MHRTHGTHGTHRTDRTHRTHGGSFNLNRLFKQFK